jgi:hypothetical protein
VIKERRSLALLSSRPGTRLNARVFGSVVYVGFVSLAAERGGHDAQRNVSQEVSQMCKAGYLHVTDEPRPASWRPVYECRQWRCCRSVFLLYCKPVVKASVMVNNWVRRNGVKERQARLHRGVTCKTRRVHTSSNGLKSDQESEGSASVYEGTRRERVGGEGAHARSGGTGGQVRCSCTAPAVAQSPSPPMIGQACVPAVWPHASPCPIR